VACSRNLIRVMGYRINGRLKEILPRVLKPGRYLGNEWNAVHKSGVEVRVALAFPDIYEIGMSHLGLRILYHILNQRPEVAAERVYAPWIDCERYLRAKGIPLFSLESHLPLIEFDLIGFTLQYEMSYTNILNMLDLAGIPLKSKDRDEKYPLIIGGGSGAFNPEPLADYFDAFVLGDGEEVINEIVDLYREGKKGRLPKAKLLQELAKIPGVYVPSFYQVSYFVDGTIKSIHSVISGIPSSIRKREIKNLDQAYYPSRIIVPFIPIVHDRVVLELSRGCTRGCRFCQAGMIYRPVRERSVNRLLELAKDSIDQTGYEEISLSSLSPSDHSAIRELSSSLVEIFAPQKVGISLASLRIDSFSLELARQVEKVRKTGLTFAPEAGTPRLRKVINKSIDEDNFYQVMEGVYSEGWKLVKLYFMIGLPTETPEDWKGIVEMVLKTARIARKIGGHRGKVNVSVATFVPKPQTPFQWEKQMPLEEIKKAVDFLRSGIRQCQNVTFKWHQPELSFLEAVFSRGDRLLGKVLETAWSQGCKFDEWSDCFRYDLWMKAFSLCGIDPHFYIYRSRSYDEVFPWEHLDCGVKKDFLILEHQKSRRGEVTSDCRQSECRGCGICNSLSR